MADDVARAAQSIVDWWTLAGVDSDFAEHPTHWLEESAQAAAPPPPAQTPAAQPPKPASASAPAAPSLAPLPDTLEAFQAWWMNDPAAEDQGIGPRIAPRGPSGARIMVLADMPCEDDAAELLSGTAGQLLDAIAHAAGEDAQALYRAALFPRRVLGAENDAGELARWRRVALRHIGLVRPKWLVLLGALPGRTLLGNDWSQNSAHIHSLNHDYGQCSALSSPHPRAMLMRPALKPLGWRAWQQLLGD